MSGSNSNAVAVPLVQFGRALGPKMVGGKMEPGEPDEVWLKVLAIKHKGERHTPAEWRALIEKYRHEPAHPSDPNYRG